ncbi:MAG: transcription antitermination factor NusB [Vicinamibacterales bacterium]
MGDVAHRPRSGTGREARHRAREAALQMLYQWEIGRLPLAQVTGDFWRVPGGTAHVVPESVQAFAVELVSGVVQHLEALDVLIVEAAEHWRLDRMAVIDRAILRLAVFEFVHVPATPAKVVINEALELARTFSTDDAVRFINGILDGIRRRLERV